MDLVIHLLPAVWRAANVLFVRMAIKQGVGGRRSSRNIAIYLTNGQRDHTVDFTHSEGIITSGKLKLDRSLRLMAVLNCGISLGERTDHCWRQCCYKDILSSSSAQH